jgi:hypothetical protein
MVMRSVALTRSAAGSHSSGACVLPSASTNARIAINASLDSDTPAAWAKVAKRVFSAREGRAVIDRPGVPRVRPVMALVPQGLNCGRAGLGLEQPEARGGVGHFGVSYAIVLSLVRG